MLRIDGLEDAFLGVAYRHGTDGPIAVYDRELCIIAIMRDGLSRDGAEEWFQYNVEGAWVGECTPIFLERQSIEDVGGEW